MTDDIRALSSLMCDEMYTHGGVGLAANQVGVTKRIIVVDVERLANKQSLRVLINPVIVGCSGRLNSTEACLSLPGISLTVERFGQVTVRAFSLDEKEIEIEATGLLAACLSHEIDHLDGITLMSKVSSLKRKMLIDILNRAKRELV